MLISLFLLPVPLSCISASEEKEPDIIIREEELPSKSPTTIIIEGPPAGHTDILIYDNATCVLSGMTRASTDTVVMEIPPGDYSVVAITNLPHELKPGGVNRLESLEAAVVNIADENPDEPVASATGSVYAGGECRLQPDRLCCRVTLAEVFNGLSGYRLLENPRIYLRNANLSAEILRSSGFRATETGLETAPAYLKYDIGMFSQHPGISLLCYPNDFEGEGSQASPPTEFVFECEVDGATIRYERKLGPLRRGQDVELSLEVWDDSWTISTAPYG